MTSCLETTAELTAVPAGSPSVLPVAPAVAVLAGRYRLDEPIASAGLGEVWRGTDLFLARPVAVKLLRPELAADAGALARFRVLAQRTGSVGHEGIARIYDYLEPGSGDRPFVVMEFVDGPSLAEVVAGGPVPPWRVMDVVAQAAAALHAAHQAGSIHGGLTPANVLLRRDGVVKLTNFGTAAGPVPGSVLGAGTLAGDLYALGVVAYQCLTGGPPPGGVPAQAALAGPGSPARAWPADGLAEAAALIGQLTAADPAIRPGDAGQVARRAGALRDHMTAEDTAQPGGAPGVPMAPASPPAPEAPTVPGRWEDRKRRGPRILLAAAAVGAAILAFLLTSVTGAHHHSHPAAAAPATPAVVDVNGPALRGQPVKAVRRQLRHLGLQVRIRWRPSPRLPAGTVRSVRPTGPVATGTTIVVVGALQPARTVPGQSPPTSGPPGPASKARHDHAPRSGRSHHSVPPTPAGSPTPAVSPTLAVSPAPTGSPVPAPTATAADSAP